VKFEHQEDLNKRTNQRERERDEYYDAWLKKYYINSLYNLPGEAPLVPEDNY
jgi:hypothetical protein